MREVTIPESGAKRKLLDTAEQLFAENGFEAVSVRDITHLAETNVAAVNYHFGSREELLALVKMHSMLPITEERLLRLDMLEKKWGARAVPLEELIDALLRSVAQQARKSILSDRSFYKLIGRISALTGDHLPGPVRDQMNQVTSRFQKAFAKALPSLSSEELAWRIHFLVGGMIHMFTHPGILDESSAGGSGKSNLESTFGRFIRFAASGLREGNEIETLPVKNTPQAFFDF